MSSDPLIEIKDLLIQWGYPRNEIEDIDPWLLLKYFSLEMKSRKPKNIHNNNILSVKSNYNWTHITVK